MKSPSCTVYVGLAQARPNESLTGDSVTLYTTTADLGGVRGVQMHPPFGG